MFFKVILISCMVIAGIGASNSTHEQKCHPSAAHKVVTKECFEANNISEEDKPQFLKAWCDKGTRKTLIECIYSGFDVIVEGKYTCDKVDEFINTANATVETREELKKAIRENCCGEFKETETTEFMDCAHTAAIKVCSGRDFDINLFCEAMKTTATTTNPQ